MSAAMSLVTRRLDGLRPRAPLGPYRLIDRIGRGGMGEVWCAVHERLDRRVAVKVIRPEALDGRPETLEDVLLRFEREARATSALTSPHTVQIHDFGRTRDGAFFYAMELLEGFTLRALVDPTGPVHPARVVHLLHQACDSLGEAHERGLVHRDIKPSNLFLTRRGLQHDFVKVLDFGLVKEVENGAAATGLTPYGAFLGTPAFMPPELVRGGLTVDPRSDVYTLGCVAYFLLTGCDVFEHDNPLHVAYAHAEETPRPPSERVGRDLDPALEALVMRCLAKAPEDRPASAVELAAALEDCGVEPAWTARDAARWWRSHYRAEDGRISLNSSATPVEERPARVLVVDDEASIRLVLARLLGQAGHEVYPAASAPEALDVIATREVDVVLTDLRMPGMGGMQLVEAIVERAPELPVVVLTAHGCVQTAVEAMRRGAADFVMKPFDRAVLLDVVEKVIARGAR